MNLDKFEKIINDSFDNKEKINSNSDKYIVDAINETIELLESDTGISGVDVGDAIDERNSFFEKTPDSPEMLFEDVVGPVDVD